MINLVKQTAESRELFCFTVNNSQCYKLVKSIVKNLAQKHKKGIFDREKALICFQRLSKMGSDCYYKEFGYKFTAADRKLASHELLQYYYENIVKNDLE